MIGILLTSAALLAGIQQEGPTLAQWAAQDAATRQIALVGTVEGVLLASSALDGASIPVNVDCFNSQTPEFLEKALLDKAAASPSMPLVQGLLSIEQCAGKRR